MISWAQAALMDQWKLSLISVLLMTALLSGCTAPISASGRLIKDVNVLDAQKLEDNGCKNLGDLEASSGWGNAMAAVGIRSAKNTIRNTAAERGATHVVWTNESGGFTSFVHGRAYRCPNYNESKTE